MWHTAIYVACPIRHVLEHDAERGESAVRSPNRLTRQPARRSGLARSRPRSRPDRLVPDTRVPGGGGHQCQIPGPHRDVNGVPAVAAPEEIDWLGWAD